MEPAKKLNPVLATVIVIALIGLLTTGAIFINNNKGASVSPTAISSNSQVQSPSVTSSPHMSMMSTYKDGTYTARGAYATPDGQESIDLTVTISNGQIKDTSLALNGITDQSREYQVGFASSYKSLVIGKRVDQVSLSRVAGASLTSDGFNTALTQIKTDAAI